MYIPQKVIHTSSACLWILLSSHPTQDRSYSSSITGSPRFSFDKFINGKCQREVTQTTKEERRGKGQLLETISSPNTNRILDQYKPFPTTICRTERRFSKLPVVTAPKELTFDYHGLQSRSRSKWLRNLKNLIQ